MHIDPLLMVLLMSVSGRMLIIGIAVGVTLGVLIIIAVVVIVCLLLYKKRSATASFFRSTSLGHLPIVSQWETTRYLH